MQNCSNSKAEYNELPEDNPSALDTGRCIYTLDPLDVGELNADTYIVVMTKNLAIL